MEILEHHIWQAENRIRKEEKMQENEIGRVILSILIVLHTEF